MSTTKSFTPYQDRDAWFVIRGYVYQVHVTISQWLRLEPDVELHLECGEDIDRVQSGLNSSEADAARMLQQVKHRQKPISLRSSPVIQALASFHSHQCANSCRKLQFRFLTTASVAKEQGSTTLKGEAALDAWERLRSGELPSEEQTVIVKAIRSLLLEGAVAYTEFKKFLKSSDDAAFLEFVRSVKWSVDEPTPEELQDQIQTDLITSGRATDEEKSRRMLERLFLHVFRVLSSKGRKILTAGALDEQLALLSVGSTDEKLLAMLGEVLRLVGQKVDAIEGMARRHEEWLTFLSRQLVAVDSQPTWNLHRERADLQGIPKPVEPAVQRTWAITVREWLGANPWVAIYGDLQSGKTQLAIQVARDFGLRVIWVRLDALKAEKESSRIDSSLALATGQLHASMDQEWYERMCQSLGVGALIVLDGLSLTVVDRALEERLVLLVEACESVGARVLSTSSRRLPTGILQRLPGKVEERKIPGFDEREITELFRLHGASGTTKKRFVEFAGGMTRNHPALLVSLARYLERANWKLDDRAWDELLGRKYDSDLKIETEQMLKHTVPDSEARSLLYRLTVETFAFMDEDVVKVAAIDPAIGLPLERLHDAMEFWIQRSDDGSYRVAALLGNLGHENLTAETTQKTHLYFAQKFFRKKPVDLLDAMSSIGHFHAAKESASAAGVLALALNAFLKEKTAKDDFGLTSVWDGVGFPDEIDLTTRLYVRSLQIAARHKLRKRYAEMLKELDELLDAAQPSDDLGVVGACVTVAIHLCVEEPATATRYAVRALKHPDVIEEWMLRPGRSGRKLQLTSLLWACAGSSRSLEDVETWLAEVAELSKTQRKTLFKRDLTSDMGCQMLCDRLWLKESDKPANERNWTKVLDLLAQIEKRSKSWGSEILWAAAIRAKIVVQAEYLGQLNGGVQTAEAALRESKGNHDVDFLLAECVGRQYRYAGKWSKATKWLDRALQGDGESFPYLRFRASLEASIAIGKSDPGLAVESCSRAVDLARKTKAISELQLVAGLSEKAIACWEANDRKAAFECWEEAATRMLNIRNRDDNWKALFGMFGHATGYFAALHSGIKPKPPEEYPVPERGWFLRERGQISELYDPKKDWFAMAHISMIAEGLGRDEVASQWALRALDTGRKIDEGGLFESFGMYAISAAVAEDRFVDALDVAARAIAHLMRTGVKGMRGPEAEMTEQDWIVAEKRTGSFVLVPAGFRLATLWVQDGERCRDLVAVLATRCRRIAETAHAPEVWTKSAEALEEIFAEGQDADVLLRKSESLVDKDEPARRMLYHLGAMLHARPAKAYELQLGFFPFLEKTYMKYGLYRQNIVPFVLGFWSRSLDAEPYLYRQPSVLRKRLEEIERSSSDGKERAALKELSWGLAIRPNAEMQEWLQRSQ